MQCPRCQTENPPQAKFCLECATPLARTCSHCGAALPASAKFCPECAHPVAVSAATQPRYASPETPKHLAEKILTSRSALEGERKQVTVLFADLKGSMELLADRDPEEARKLLDPVLERMMEAVHHYEGTVNQVMGDTSAKGTSTRPSPCSNRALDSAGAVTFRPGSPGSLRPWALRMPCPAGSPRPCLFWSRRWSRPFP